MITITETARQKIATLKEKLRPPVRGIRVTASPRSPFRASFTMRLIREGEPETPADLVESFDEIDVYIDPGAAPYLEGASIDYVMTLMASGFTLEAPPRKVKTPEGALAERIQKVLDDEVNPALSMHGGGATLIGVEGGRALVELTGACQGCGLAPSTLKDGVEAAIRECVPEIQEVVDITDHAEGRHPYVPQRPA